MIFKNQNSPQNHLVVKLVFVVVQSTCFLLSFCIICSYVSCEKTMLLVIIYYTYIAEWTRPFCQGVSQITSVDRKCQYFDTDKIFRKISMSLSRKIECIIES